MSVPIQAKDGRGLFTLPQAPEDSGYYVFGTPGSGAAQYAHPKLLTLLLKVEREWQAVDTRKFGIGNISVANGLPFGHESHRSGLEVDVRPLRKDGARSPVVYTESEYDRDATAKLIAIFRTHAPGSISIFFNEPENPRSEAAREARQSLSLPVQLMGGQMFLPLLLVTLNSSSSAAVADTPIPPDAKHAILAVRSAAKGKNFVELRRWMVADFLWSFGGDGDADQAISAWKHDRQSMRELYRVTGQKCAFVKGTGIVQCPPNAGYHYRAGFKYTSDGWRMSYFVAGD